jgi:hypothetical protein
MARCSRSSSPRRSLDRPRSCSPSRCSVRPGESFASLCHSSRFAGWVGHCRVLGESCTRAMRAPTKSPALWRVRAAAASLAVLLGKAALLGFPREHGPQSRSAPFARPPCCGCGVSPDRQRPNRTIDRRRRMGLCRRGGCGHTSLCLRGRRSPPNGSTHHDGRGNWSRVYVHASLRGHLPANSDDAAQTHRLEIDGTLPCLLVGVFGCEWNPRGMDSVNELQTLAGRARNLSVVRVFESRLKIGQFRTLLWPRHFRLRSMS